MFALAFAIGIFSYGIFLLGILGWLYVPIIIGITIVYWICFVILKKNTLRIALLLCKKRVATESKSLLIILLLIWMALQMLINFIGVLGPELGFDALWYHLTLPKLYLLWHQILHIPGGLLYYSDMPKLTEMLYIPGIVLFSDIGAKAIHFLFGILSCIALYKLGRKFFTPLLSLLTVAIFYSNLVVGWESISAYIDLSRTFFEIVALIGFFNWYESKKRKWLMYAAICMGLTIATKFLAIADIGIFLIGIFLVVIFQKRKTFFIDCILFVICTLLIPLPWWVFSFLNTHNPFYPFFTPIYPFAHNFSLQPFRLVVYLWDVFTHSSDPISFLYIAFLPFLWIVRKWSQKEFLLLVIGLVSILTWNIYPQTGGGRVLLPYLPVLPLLAVFVYQGMKTRFLKALFLSVLFIALGSSLGYRTVANIKFIPVIFGFESKAKFLSTHLNFSFGDFYDIDGYMAHHIKSSDTVLLYGYHNLYYVDFPFIHQSWVKKGDAFDYVATDTSPPPHRFASWQLVYANPLTHIHVYKKERKIWNY